LLITEIEFLAEYGHLASTVVYAGSSPGTHIAILAQLFSSHKFILHDANGFSIEETDQIKIESHGSENNYKNFAETVAKKYAERAEKILFISDIRATGPNSKFDSETSLLLALQMQWHQIMKPEMSMLKFRLSYREGITKFFDGKIKFQPWAPRFSTETRIIVSKDAKIRTYNNKDYEMILYWHNQIARAHWYKHAIKDVSNCDGLDHCYDCASEVHILEKYLKINPSEKLKMDKNALSKELAGMSRMLSKALGAKNLFQPPHGVLPDVKDYSDKIAYLYKMYGTQNEKYQRGLSRCPSSGAPVGAALALKRNPSEAEVGIAGAKSDKKSIPASEGKSLKKSASNEKGRSSSNNASPIMLG
jgi:cap2 methyltransferase